MGNTNSIIVEKIVALLKPKAVAVFGSHARGEAGRLSDFDVLVITSDEKDLGRLDELEFDNVEIHALTFRRALELVHKQDPFFVKIIFESKPLYGEFYLKFLREVSENVRKSKNMA